MPYLKGPMTHPAHQRSAMQARVQALSLPKCPIGHLSPSRSQCGLFQSGQ